MQVQITNWHDLVVQFGLEDRTDDLLSAKQLSKELTKRVDYRADENIFIPCNANSEADACFIKESKTEHCIYYSYTGTAN